MVDMAMKLKPFFQEKSMGGRQQPPFYNMKFRS